MQRRLVMRTVASTSVSAATPTISGAPRSSEIEPKTSDNVLRPALLDDPRSKRILAKTIYRELRDGGVAERDVLAIATELLSLVAEELRAG